MIVAPPVQNDIINHETNMISNVWHRFFLSLKDKANKHANQHELWGEDPLGELSVKCVGYAGTVLYGLQVIDDYKTISGDKILIIDGDNNGIYKIAETSWSKVNVSMHHNTVIYVENGTIHKGLQYKLATLDPIDNTPYLVYGYDTTRDDDTIFNDSVGDFNSRVLCSNCYVHPQNIREEWGSKTVSDLNSTYVLFTVTNMAGENPIDLYSWFNIDGNGIDPAIAGRAGIGIDRSSTDDISEVVGDLKNTVNDWFNSNYGSDLFTSRYTDPDNGFAVWGVVHSNDWKLASYQDGNTGLTLTTDLLGGVITTASGVYRSAVGLPTLEPDTLGPLSLWGNGTDYYKYASGAFYHLDSGRPGIYEFVPIESLDRRRIIDLDEDSLLTDEGDGSRYYNLQTGNVYYVHSLNDGTVNISLKLPSAAVGDSFEVIVHKDCQNWVYLSNSDGSWADGVERLLFMGEAISASNTPDGWMKTGGVFQSQTAWLYPPYMIPPSVMDSYPPVWFRMPNWTAINQDTAARSGKDGLINTTSTPSYSFRILRDAVVTFNLTIYTTGTQSNIPGYESTLARAPNFANNALFDAAAFPTPGYTVLQESRTVKLTAGDEYFIYIGWNPIHPGVNGIYGVYPLVSQCVMTEVSVV